MNSISVAIIKLIYDKNFLKILLESEQYVLSAHQT